MLLIAVGSFALLLAVAYLIAVPMLRPDLTDEAVEATAGTPSLLDTKERLLSDIRELDLDLATGKLDEQDHLILRAAALAEAAGTVRAIEEADGSAGDVGRPEVAVTAPMSLEDLLEEQIEARKRTIGDTVLRDRARR